MSVGRVVLSDWNQPRQRSQCCSSPQHREGSWDMVEVFPASWAQQTSTLAWSRKLRCKRGGVGEKSYKSLATSLQRRSSFEIFFFQPDRKRRKRKPLSILMSVSRHPHLRLYEAWVRPGVGVNASATAMWKTEPMRRKKRRSTARSSGIRSNCIISQRWG